MRCHSSTLHTRILRAAARVTCAIRVVAVGLNAHGDIIAISTNATRFQTHSDAHYRGWHAEERLMHRAPASLARILLARVGRSGRFNPIHPCAHCAKLAAKRGVTVEQYT